MSAMASTLSLVEDGVTYIIDAETGEVIEAKADFRVDDEDKAQWLLERLNDLDSSMAALGAKKQAILDNLSVMENRIKARRDALLFKFQADLETVARENLEKGKKSWVCPYGSVQFRTNPARLKVADQDKALAWAKDNDIQEAIKRTEEFQISKLDPSWKKLVEDMDPTARVERGFDLTPESESVTIKTGV